MAETLLYFVNHASVLLRYDEALLITDPWFSGTAFSSWTPAPPPALNPDMLVGLSNAGRLSVILSHAHPDHTDVDFLKRLNKQTRLYVPRFGDDHFTALLRSAGIINVTEIGNDETRCGPFLLRAFPHRHSATDASIAICAPDAFIFHGNDAWELGAEKKELARAKPKHRRSLFMGQGGSASGFPLTYLNFLPAERADRLREKNERMLKALAHAAQESGFDRALAYACFARVTVNEKDYAFRAPTPHGAYANKVTGTKLFLDLSPGDVYIPAEDRVLAVLSSLHVDQRCFPDPRVEQNFSKVSEQKWRDHYEGALHHFMTNFDAFLTHQIKAGLAGAEDLGLDFGFDLVGDNGIVSSRRWMLCGGTSKRSKTCRVTLPVMAAVLDRTIPFEDLYTGYLAEWRRNPDHYNLRFIQSLLDYGYQYFNDKTNVCENSP